MCGSEFQATVEEVCREGFSVPYMWWVSDICCMGSGTWKELIMFPYSYRHQIWCMYFTGGWAEWTWSQVSRTLLKNFRKNTTRGHNRAPQSDSTDVGLSKNVFAHFRSSHLWKATTPQIYTQLQKSAAGSKHHLKNHYSRTCVAAQIRPIPMPAE